MAVPAYPTRPNRYPPLIEALRQEVLDEIGRLADAGGSDDIEPLEGVYVELTRQAIKGWEVTLEEAAQIRMGLGSQVQVRPARHECGPEICHHGECWRCGYCALCMPEENR